MVGPLQKFTNRGEYDRTVEGLMYTKGYTREEAEKEYNAFLDNPNNYALQKVSSANTCSASRFFVCAALTPSNR